jgi:hypothetical protein
LLLSKIITTITLGAEKKFKDCPLNQPAIAPNKSVIAKPRRTRKREIIKIRVEINGIETKKKENTKNQ